MSLESIVVTQATALALKEAGWPQGTSVFQWIHFNYEGIYGQWNVAISQPWRAQKSYYETLDAPTASELGEALPMISYRSQRLAGYIAVTADGYSPQPEARGVNETEARAQLYLWLAKNRPESLGNWRKKP